MASCLQPKIQALKFRDPLERGQLTLPVPADQQRLGAAAQRDAQPNLAFLQLDGVRAQKQANTALALAHRMNAVEAYDLAVRKYKANKKSVQSPS